ncbi:MAG TPA: PBP1A family penicillin-binding protein [Bacilli bacterium]|nr:PBP1A family penicillin-binding protein [Bacilli bacterium]
MFRRLFRFGLFMIVLGLGAFVGLLTYIKTLEPPPLQVTQTSVFYGANDEVIGKNHNGKNQLWVPFEQIAPAVIDATIAIEDRKFFKHHGFDYMRIAGTIIANIKSGSKSQGASTITMQYARNLFLHHEKTWERKINEALYALRLEMNYSKKDIIEGYLNTIYYGHGAYGIEAASLHYFHKHANELTLAEAAMLAGIPKGPTYYSPLVDFERAKDRQEIILDAMVETGALKPAQAREAKVEKLVFRSKQEDKLVSIAPYFQDAVKKQLIEHYKLDEELMEQGGLHIYTTLDVDMQKEAEKWIEAEIDKSSELQTSLIAIDPRSGDVKALIGGRDYMESSFNRAIDARRAPGSTFKPFLYYAALENGFTPTSTLVSEKTTFTFDDGNSSYSPSNFGHKYANDFITLLQAMAYSDNIYAVKTHMFLGNEQLVNTAKKVGIESPLEEIPSLALGTKPVTMLEMVKGYSAFANGGYRVTPRFIRKVVDLEGNVLVEEEPERTLVLDPRLAFVLTDMMSAMFEPQLNDYTSVTGQSIAHLIKRPLAGKSGSTAMDSWMIGYAPQLVTGVWTGYDKEKTMNSSTEGLYAKRIWANFMEGALANELKLSFQVPGGVVGVTIDAKTGMLANDTCPTQRLTYFVAGSEPTVSCTEHEATEENMEVERQQHEKEKFLERFIRWFRP